jgi:hypothetical protein
VVSSKTIHSGPFFGVVAAGIWVSLEERLLGLADHVWHVFFLLFLFFSFRLSQSTEIRTSTQRKVDAWIKLALHLETSLSPANGQRVRSAISMNMLENGRKRRIGEASTSAPKGTASAKRLKSIQSSRTPNGIDEMKNPENEKWRDFCDDQPPLSCALVSAPLQSTLPKPALPMTPPIWAQVRSL